MASNSEEIIGLKTNPFIAHNVVESIARLSTTYFQETYIHFGIIQQDVDDNKFVDCAIASNAEYIVSNDAHFNILKSLDWPKVHVISLSDYYSDFLLSH